VGEGPYAKYDIGAGTTNASVFRITAELQGGVWVKTRMAFFGAHSEPCGMDDICSAIHGSKEIHGASMFDYRGKEAESLADPRVLRACAPAMEGIESTFREAWRQMWVLNRGGIAEIQAWETCSVAFIGGGSVVERLVGELGRHPFQRHILPRLRPDVPVDLVFDGGAPPRHALPFLLVAYGLSTIGLEIPEATGPDDTQPMPTIAGFRQRLDHEDIYGT
jgi:hypothetical protein